MDKNLIDVKENDIYKLDYELLTVLLKDRTSGKNIIWATNNYEHHGFGYQATDYITEAAITGYHGNIVKPRTKKSKKEQLCRVREKAEVFTPSWICNKQNNTVDNAWLGIENAFNVEEEMTWHTTSNPIPFPTQTNKQWKDYVYDIRLEITCGEAPYLVSRYDTVTGDSINIGNRIGLLDRKLRIVSENTKNENEWIKWATLAFKSVFGFDWQGDNVLLARENLLFTFIDYYFDRFEKKPDAKLLRNVAEIISWNIWQMDGLKFVIPNSCKETTEDQLSLFNVEPEKHECMGCTKNNPFLHTGQYCRIKDWKENKIITFVSLVEKK